MRQKKLIFYFWLFAAIMGFQIWFVLPIFFGWYQYQHWMWKKYRPIHAIFSRQKILWNHTFCTWIFFLAAQYVMAGFAMYTITSQDRIPSNLHEIGAKRFQGVFFIFLCFWPVYCGNNWSFPKSINFQQALWVGEGFLLTHKTALE